MIAIQQRSSCQENTRQGNPADMQPRLWCVSLITLRQPHNRQHPVSRIRRWHTAPIMTQCRQHIVYAVCPVYSWCPLPTANLTAIHPTPLPVNLFRYYRARYTADGLWSCKGSFQRDVVDATSLYQQNRIRKVYPAFYMRANWFCVWMHAKMGARVSKGQHLCTLFTRYSLYAWLRNISE